MWSVLFTADVWTEYLIPGLINTLKAAAISIVLAVVFGLVFGMGRLSHNGPIRWVCGIVVEFFRSVPVLLMMYFFFQLFAFNNSSAPTTTRSPRSCSALTLYNGSVIAELVRSGVHGLPSGQSEAGLSIGLTAGQTLRSIQLPQALTAMLPALVGQLVVILKDSALGTAITYPELLPGRQGRRHGLRQRHPGLHPRRGDLHPDQLRADDPGRPRRASAQPPRPWSAQGRRWRRRRRGQHGPAADRRALRPRRPPDRDASRLATDAEPRPGARRRP